MVIAKVNTDQDHDNALKYGVRGIPTMLLFKNGQEVDRVVGALPKAQLEQWIDSAIIQLRVGKTRRGTGLARK